MESQDLEIDCAELRDLAEEAPVEMEVVVEMLIEADEELCTDEAS